jgi:hypothetical protein
MLGVMSVCETVRRYSTYGRRRHSVAYSHLLPPLSSRAVIDSGEERAYELTVWPAIQHQQLLASI